MAIARRAAAAKSTVRRTTHFSISFGLFSEEPRELPRGSIFNLLQRCPRSNRARRAKVSPEDCEFNLCRIKCFVNRQCMEVSFGAVFHREHGNYFRRRLTFMLWFASRGSPSDLRAQTFSRLCRIGTSPQGVDILSTVQQHFVLSHRFALDRIFAVVYSAPSDSGGT